MKQTLTAAIILTAFAVSLSAHEPDPIVLPGLTMPLALGMHTPYSIVDPNILSDYETVLLSSAQTWSYVAIGTMIGNALAIIIAVEVDPLAGGNTWHADNRRLDSLYRHDDRCDYTRVDMP